MSEDFLLQLIIGLRWLCAAFLKATLYFICFFLHVRVVQAEDVAECIRMNIDSCFYSTSSLSHRIKSPEGWIWLRENASLIDRKGDWLLLTGQLGIEELVRPKRLVTPFVEFDLPEKARLWVERSDEHIKVVNLGPELLLLPRGGDWFRVLAFSEVEISSVGVDGKAFVSWPRTLLKQDLIDFIYPFIQSQKEPLIRKTMNQAIQDWQKTTETLSALTQDKMNRELANEKERQRLEDLLRARQEQESKKLRELFRERVFLGEF